MPIPNLFHDWMKFSYLDDNEGLTCSFTIGYRFIDERTEGWTQRFNAFKYNKPKAKDRCLNVMRVAVPRLVTELGIDPLRTVFVPALRSHEEMACEDGVLSYIAKNSARQQKIRFVRDALRKKPHQPLHGLPTSEERNEVLTQAKYTSDKIEADNILVFDDFITRGSTLSHIALAIQRTNGPNVRVYGVALGKNEKQNYKKHFGIPPSNDHIPNEWLDLWNRGNV